jgi:hypothetical protein
VHRRGDAPDNLAWGVEGRVGAVQPGRRWSSKAFSSVWKHRVSNNTLYIYIYYGVVWFGEI